MRSERTCSAEEFAFGHASQWHRTRLHEFALRPAAAFEQFPLLVPLRSQPAELVRDEFSLALPSALPSQHAEPLQLAVLESSFVTIAARQLFGRATMEHAGDPTTAAAHICTVLAQRDLL